MNKITICTLLTIISLLGFTTLVQADEISPNPNPIDSSIVITNGTENASNFTNHGNVSINTSGVLNNSGDLYNGTLDNTFGSLTNSGNLNNTGNLGNSGYLDNSGNLSNFGNLNNGIYSDNPDNQHPGYLNNSGTLTNFASATLNTFSYLDSSGILNNYGQLSNGTSNDHAGYLGNTGTLTNFIGGTLDIFGYLGNLEGGTLNNYGNLSNGSFGDHTGYLDNLGTLTNFGGGTLNIYSAMGNAGALKNSGTLNNSGGIFGNGTYEQTAGQTTINGMLNQSSVQINGGNLGGIGTISTTGVTIGSGATVNAGNTLDTLTINGDFSSSGSLIFEIGGMGSSDVLNIFGNANFTGGNIEFDLINGFKASAGDFWDFLFASTLSGWNAPSFTFNGLDQGLGWNISQIGNGGNRLSITSIPEPETLTLFITGLGLMGFMVQRRKTAV